MINRSAWPWWVSVSHDANDVKFLCETRSESAGGLIKNTKSAKINICLEVIVFAEKQELDVV